ncbi:hypothetical protein DFH06DRAFT_1215126 [Mycena polygramma]|nr:hypothetical protein DFH06DRAFT_1215126 [Mycena polygramma]
MARRIAYNFRPEFPDSTVDRYPSLSRALGNNYPGLRSVTPEAGCRELFNSPSEPVPNARPFRPRVPAAEEISSGRTSDLSFNNSILGNGVFPRSGLPPHCAPPHAFSEVASEVPYGRDDFIPIRNSPALLDAASDFGDLRLPAGRYSIPSPRLNAVAEYDQHDSINRSKTPYPRRPSAASSETAYENGYEYSIPICDSPSSFLDTASSSDFPDLASSVGSSSPSPRSPLTCPTVGRSERVESGSNKHHRPKAHECPICHECFTRPSELQTHKNMHTGKQPFVCDFPGCRKKFGVRSNLQRHQVAHGVERSGRGRPIGPYEVKFEPPSHGPSVPSDTTSMPTEIVWDHEGPFSRRAARVHPSQAETSRGARTWTD